MSLIIYYGDGDTYKTGEKKPAFPDKFIRPDEVKEVYEMPRKIMKGLDSPQFTNQIEG